MSEERLQEIKDSIKLQYKVQEANNLDSFNIFTDEEQELLEEVERLNKENEHLRTALNTKENIIKEVRELVQKADIYRNYDDEEDDTWYTDLNLDKVLEILDKENK